jgi:hypothetical protein
VEALPLATLALLGAYHGLNPAMGWLFAVGLGMQDRDRRSVLRALPAIASGNRQSLAIVVAVVLGVGLLADPQPLHLGAGAALVGFGGFRFVKPRAHPRWTTMRVSRGELTWWSFLMSSAHGAGLMVAPVLIGSGGASAAHAHAGEIHAGMTNTMSVGQGLVGITVHVGAMLLVMAIVSLVVYEKLGLAFLRRAWVNSDQMWATAFILAGVVTFVS